MRSPKTKMINEVFIQWLCDDNQNGWGPMLVLFTVVQVEILIQRYKKNDLFSKKYKMPKYNSNTEKFNSATKC